MVSRENFLLRFFWYNSIKRTPQIHTERLQPRRLRSRLLTSRDIVETGQSRPQRFVLHLFDLHALLLVLQLGLGELDQVVCARVCAEDMRVSTTIRSDQVGSRVLTFFGGAKQLFLLVCLKQIYPATKEFGRAQKIWSITPCFFSVTERNVFKMTEKN